VKLGAGLALCIFLVTCQSARPSRDQLLIQVESALCKGNSRAIVTLLSRNSWAWDGDQADVIAARLTLCQVEALLDLKEDSNAEVLMRGLVLPPNGPAILRAHQAMIQGLMALRAQQSDQAWARLVEAERLARQNGADRVLARVLNMMAYLRYLHGDLAGAIAFDTQAVTAARLSGEVPTRVKSLNNLGVHLLRQDNYETAVDLLEEARNLNQSDDPNLANILINLGDAYTTIGNFAKAEQTFETYRALPLDRQASRQKFLGIVGNHHFRAGRFGDAIAALREAFEQARADQDWFYAGLWAANLAGTMVRIDNWEEGEHWFDQAVKYRELAKDNSEADRMKLLRANIDINLCRFDQAEAVVMDLMIRANRSDDPNLRWQATVSQGFLLLQQGLDDQAFLSFKQGIKFLEESPGMIDPEDQIRYFDALVLVYETLVDRLMALNRSDEALEMVESSRARLLRFRAADMERTPNLSVTQVPADTAMFAFSLSPFRSYLWVLTREGRQVYLLPNQGLIQKLVEGHNQQVEQLKDPMRAASTVSRELTEILVAPAAAQLRGKKRVVIVADGALQRLSFETLPSPMNPARYWIEDQEICLSPALALYLSQPERPRAIQSMLLVGHPNYDSSDLPNLPGAVAELATIQSHFLDRRLDMLTGGSATRSRFLKAQIQQYDVIHFATHVVVNDYSPLSSSVMLSPEQGPQPSRVTAQDFMVEDLSKVELVTLSACSSAGTHSYNGEGLTGLAWAFLWSGAHHVVASLWNVDDQATAQLMDAFYAHLSRGETPVQALRQAKLKLIRSEGRYRKPYYWGAFQTFVR
jgi:CHAT domain-containing protein/Flp pilus assembly protein TadD